MSIEQPDYRSTSPQLRVGGFKEQVQQDGIRMHMERIVLHRGIRQGYRLRKQTTAFSTPANYHV